MAAKIPELNRAEALFLQTAIKFERPPKEIKNIIGGGSLHWVTKLHCFCVCYGFHHLVLPAGELSRETDPSFFEAKQEGCAQAEPREGSLHGATEGDLPPREG